MVRREAVESRGGRERVGPVKTIEVLSMAESVGLRQGDLAEVMSTKPQNFPKVVALVISRWQRR